MELLDFIDDDEDMDVGVVSAAAAAASASAEGNLVVVVLHCSTLGPSLSKVGGEGVVVRHLGVELVECNRGVDGLLLPPPPPDPDENIPPIPNLT